MNDPSIQALRLDHIGIQVSNLETAIETFTKLFGYHQATSPIVNTRHRVRVVFLEKQGSIPLKLISDVEPRPGTATKLHHLAFRADDLDQSIQQLQANGARVLTPPAPGEAFDNEPIAFLFAGGLNVELVATDSRSGRIQDPESTGQD